jgi:TRAP-type C4-dicarboxylate transport system permease small subunit
MVMKNLLPPSPPAPAPLRWVGAVVDTLMVLLGAALVVVVFGNVVLHAFDKDIAWTTEFGELVMVWTTFLGVAAAVQRNAHMAVSELVDLLPEPQPRLIADGLTQLMVAGILVLLVWYGGVAANESWGSVLTVLGWPMAVQYLSLPACSAVALVFVLWDLVQIFRGIPRQQRYTLSGVSTA